MAKKNFLYVLPLLTLLSVSPAELLEHKTSRSPASAEVEVIEEKEEKLEEKKFARFEAMISQIDPSNLLIVESITKESVIEKAESLQAQIKQEAEKFNKDATDKEEIKLQRESIESLVVDAVIFDKEVAVLDEQEALDEESKEKLLLAGDSHKEQLELLIAELENNEEILDIDPPKLADAEEPKEEVEEKKEEEEAPKVAIEDVKEEEKVEDKKEEVCAASEQVKVLTAQVEKLMEEQNLILQAMLNLTQVMLNMSQNMQQQQPYFPMPQTAYQYHAPMSQGNWVYYPQGFNPQQSFYPNQAYSSPQQQQPQQQLPQGQFQNNNWNLQPSPNFQFNQAPQMPIEVGQFGLNQPQPMNSFNFSSNSLPMLGML
ncbi:MAG TPA: hypothetical protein VKZ84_02110 [Bacteriovoracaceae bacterium]|nr:hypothetical protein [Bacteriovoracaceae bacterium]